MSAAPCASCQVVCPSQLYACSTHAHLVFEKQAVPAHHALNFLDARKDLNNKVKIPNGMRSLPW